MNRMIMPSQIVVSNLTFRRSRHEPPQTMFEPINTIQLVVFLVVVLKLLLGCFISFAQASKMLIVALRRISVMRSFECERGHAKDSYQYFGVFEY